MKEISLDDAFKKFEAQEKVISYEESKQKPGYGYMVLKKQFYNFGHFCDWLKQEGYAIV